MDKISNLDSFNKRVADKLKRVSLKHLYKLEDLIIDLCPLSISYDVTKTQGFNFDEFGYTELFKNAIYVYPQNCEYAYKILELSRAEFKGDIDKSKQSVLNNIAYFDKYKLKTIGEFKFNSICFLPGSNILRHCVAIDNLLKWAYLDKELMFKPHPLTNSKDLNELKYYLGSSRIFQADISGFELLNGANRVYCTSSSELGLYAKLQDKEVIDITSFNCFSDLAYSAFYRYLNYPFSSNKELIKVLSSPLSGIFFYNDEDLDVKVKKYFDTVLNLQKQNQNYSNFDYKLIKRGQK